MNSPAANAINFQQIAARNGSQADAFEEFCCQIARRDPRVPEGSQFLRYRGAGGDGGVECIWRLPNGEEWGWQAKFIFDLNHLKAALDTSISTAIRIHPQLQRYVICIPFDLTGPTGRKGRSQMERFETYREGWLAEAAAAGVTVEIELLTASALADGLLRIDPEGGRRRYWFDETILSEAWFQQKLSAAQDTAGPRYTPELRIETPITENFLAFGRTEHWIDVLIERRNHLRRSLDSWRRTVNTPADTRSGIPAFPEKLRENGQRVLELLQQLVDGLTASIENKHQDLDLTQLNDTCREALALVNEIYPALVSVVEEEHGEGQAESASFKQWMREYQLQFPTAHVDDAKELQEELEDLAEWLGNPGVVLYDADSFLLNGNWGAGKTFAICDIAGIRHEQGLRSIVLFGEHFTDAAPPWEQIRQLLGLDATMGQAAVFSALDAAGEASGFPLLLSIDGLNETRPRSFWRNYLAALVNELSDHSWVRLCVSCRSTYESLAIPDGLALPTVTHQGFVGQELNAAAEYFLHYGLEPPVAPILHPEFSNPLFLRLICEASAGQERLPAGWYGVSRAINAILSKLNREFAQEHGVREEHRAPERGLESLATAMRERNMSALTWTEADDLLSTVLPSSHQGVPLIDWLVNENALILDAQIAEDDERPVEMVRIAFDRLGDHLLATNLLAELSAKELPEAIAPDGSLHFLFEDVQSCEEYAGTIEALTIQIPERLGMELLDLFEVGEVRQAVLRLTINGLLWRDPGQMSTRVRDILYEALLTRDLSDAAFDVLLSISVFASPVDAFLLFDAMSERNMARRDEFWCMYLHDRYEDKGPVERLIRESLFVDARNLDEEMTLRWAVVLLLFCASPDRRIRDDATKGLVNITQHSPLVWNELVRRFIAYDDDYVFERCLAAAYGVLLRTRDLEAERGLAVYLYQQIFVDQVREPHAMIRDYARMIIQLADMDGVLDQGLEIERALPPYQSEWPLDIPTEEFVEQEKEKSWLDRIYVSCMVDDFYTYRLDNVAEPFPEFSQDEIGRWIFGHVLDLGYTERNFQYYDGYMMQHYGHLRGRPTFAERVGKKYQWIALARLIARLSDNAEIVSPSYEPEPLVHPLPYLDGRNIDPSVLERVDHEGTGPSWWFPQNYAFEKVSDIPDQEWLQDLSDLPSPMELLGPQKGPGGRQWVPLYGYPVWTTKKDTDEWGTPYRRLWMLLHAYLIPQDDEERFWEWVSQQSFRGRWMPEDAEYHGGFVGEYPWGPVFNYYPEEFIARGGSGRHNMPEIEMMSAFSTVFVDHQYDLSREGSIIYSLPARVFFEQAPLVWDAAAGYHVNGVPAFTCPSVSEPGPRSLLVDYDFIRNFLDEQGYSLVWTLLGEKQVLGSRDSRPGPVTFSRAMRLTASGFEASADFIVEK